MLSDGESPGQQTTLPMSLRGRPSRGLYQSPPLRRTYPPNSPTNRAKSFGRDKPYDSCEDITAYALNVVKNLEIPDDERSEKEEFLKDLEEIVQRIRPSRTHGFLWQQLTRSGKSGGLRQFCKYVYHCKFGYRLLCYRSRFNVRSAPTIRFT